MKKKGGVIFLLLILSLLTVNLVAAQSVAQNIESALNSISDGVNPIAKFIVGDTPTGEFLLIKLLFLLVIISVIYTSVKQISIFNQYNYLPGFISFIIGIIAIRFLGTEAIVNFIWLPTGVLGIALTTLLPFILYAVFVESFDSKLIRQVSWSLFAVIYTGIAMVRWTDLTPAGIGSIAGQNIPANLSWTINLGWLYLATALLAILAIFLDRPIRRALVGKKMQDHISNLNLTERGEIREDIKLLTKSLGTADNKEAIRIRQRIRDLERRSRDLY
ncbi:MAG: hypothetical protein AABX03_01755 [Nanoarchaeota archaeon]